VAGALEDQGLDTLHDGGRLAVCDQGVEKLLLRDGDCLHGWLSGCHRDSMSVGGDTYALM
jgi:hypothetical protein